MWRPPPPGSALSAYFTADPAEPNWLRDHWLTTAPQRLPGYVGARVPWGTVHARPDGTRTTACGLSTTTWFTFWSLPFDLRGRTSCPDCVATIRKPHQPVGVRTTSAAQQRQELAS